MDATEVFIAGAGPTGLALALWLTRQGVKVRIIDKSQGPGTTSRAMAVQARTLEFYGQLDLADAIVAEGKKNPRMNLWLRGRRRASIALGSAGIAHSPYPFMLVYPQDRHERKLIETLETLGVTVERMTALVDFTDTGEHIRLRTKAADGTESECQAQYLAGCDGARSFVRHGIGGSFEGGTYPQLFYVADVMVSAPKPLGESHIGLGASNVVAFLSYDEIGSARLIGTVHENPSGTVPLDFRDVAQDALRSIGIHVQRVKWFSTYKVHHRVTDKYRQGRAFLLGDAAHVHSPAGGQGMNTGIGDAINLAWKLKAVLRGTAPASLLDTYESERKAFAEKLVETTDRVFTAMTSQGKATSFIRQYLVPMIAPLAFRLDAVRKKMSGTISQTRINYRTSPLSAGSAGSVHAGDRLPWVQSGDSDNFMPLKAMDWQVHIYGDPSPALRDFCAERRVGIHDFKWRAEFAKAGFKRNAVYLIRPDMHVAWADEQGSVDQLAAYFATHGLAPGHEHRPSRRQ